MVGRGFVHLGGGGLLGEKRTRSEIIRLVHFASEASGLDAESA